MDEEFETVELEVSEDDIVYYLFDEDDNEIGFVIEEDGQEVEYYYEWVNSEEYADLEATEVEDVAEDAQSDDRIAYEDSNDENAEEDGEEFEVEVDLADLDGEVIEMEIDEEAIDHYLFDTEGNEVGFVIVEDGVEIECYYQGDDEDDEDDGSGGDGQGGLFTEPNENRPDDEPPAEHGYLYKMAQIAGYEGNKARKKAGEQLGRARDKAAPVVEAARSKAEQGVDKATEAVESGGQKLKAKSDEYDLGITREGVSEATADLNAIAKEGAATAKELKAAYDDIMDSFGFLMPKTVRRKLP